MPNSDPAHVGHDAVAVKIGEFTFEKRGIARFDFRDPYHLAVGATWPRFTLGMIALYLAINFVFAVLYVLQPGCVLNVRGGSISDAFFFSVETLATVGYGVMSPATTYGHLISTAEIMTGNAFTAVMTGLIFVRFSKPKAKMFYSGNGVIGMWRDAPALMFRVGNGRVNVLHNVQATIDVGLLEKEADGQLTRRVHGLKLVRSNMPFLALTWTIMHRIDPSSPLYGMTPEKLAESDAHFLLHIEAHDAAIGGSVRDFRSYHGRDIRFNSRFVDKTEMNDHTHFRLDLNSIHLMEPDTHHESPKDSFVGSTPSDDPICRSDETIDPADT
jgi:inward rectifier potassium channel